MADVGLFELDGSVLEGGGQILRNSIAYAALLRKNIAIKKIRAGREKPGLKNQHLAGILLVGKLFHAEIEGAVLQSSSISFKSTDVESISKFYEGSMQVDANGAGSVALLIQISLPCLLFGPKKCFLTCKGGTNASFAPPIDFTIDILNHYLVNYFGADFSTKLLQRGYHPKGCGLVRLEVNPIKQLKCVDITERGNLQSISILVLEPTVNNKNSKNKNKKIDYDSSIKDLTKALKEYKVDVQFTKEETGCSSASVYICATFDSGVKVSGSSVESPDNFESALEMFQTSMKGCCADEYLADQLVIFMALAKGKSKLRIGPMSLHTKTAIYIAEKLTGVVFLETPVENGLIIECEGIGYSNMFLD